MILTRCAPSIGDRDADTGWISVAQFDDLVASWAVPGDADTEVLVRGRRGSSEAGPYVLGRRSGGRWSSVPGQRDVHAHVDVDTLVTAVPFDAFRLEVHGGVAQEGVRLAAITSLRDDLPGASAPLAPPAALELAVEPLSQMTFAGALPHLDGGGASWCSPTALTMVLRFHGLDAEVPETAAAVYDPPYGGCGNWSLNVAHAAERGLDAVVTRLAGLVDVAVLLGAGVPVVASIAVEPGALPGFPLEQGTAGHLVVVSGLTAEGDAVVLDPAAPEGAVRRVYAAAAFERCWIAGAGGLAYVVRPPDLLLPVGSGRW